MKVSLHFEDGVKTLRFRSESELDDQILANMPDGSIWQVEKPRPAGLSVIYNSTCSQSFVSPTEKVEG